MSLRKRILTAIIAGSLAVILGACGGRADKASSAPTAAASENSSEASGSAGSSSGSDMNNQSSDSESISGATQGTVYQNEFFDVKLDAASGGLTLATKEQLAAILKVTAKVMNSDDVKAMIDSGSGWMDMYAANQDQSRSINFMLQKAGVPDSSSQEQIVASMVPVLRKQMESNGLTNLEVGTGICTFKGARTPCVNLSGSYNGIMIYEKQVYEVRDGYSGCITASTHGSDDTQSLLDLITAVK